MARVSYQGIADAKPPEVAQTGFHDLRITAADADRKSKTSGSTMTRVRIEILDAPNAQAIFHNLIDPRSYDAWLEDNEGKTEGDWEKAQNFIALNTKQFFERFEVAYDEDGYESDDLLGQTARVFLDIQAREDNPSQRSNVLNFEKLPPA